jgi:hypothetical protein
LEYRQYGSNPVLAVFLPNYVGAWFYTHKKTPKQADGKDRRWSIIKRISYITPKKLQNKPMAKITVGV